MGTKIVENADPAVGAITDRDGKFFLKNVPLGRWQVQCSYVGYEPWLSDPIIVNSAREPFLNILISEGATNQMQEVVVTAQKRGNEPINDLSMLSTRSFSVDETQRYACYFSFRQLRSRKGGRSWFLNIR